MKKACLGPGMVLGATLLTITIAQAQTPLYDIPQLEHMTIDGKADDWQGKGLRVEALVPMTGGRRPAANFSAGLRLGWNEKGLLALVTVRDDTASEGKNPKALWLKDSVELFFGAKQGVRSWVQVAIGPGKTRKRPMFGSMSMTTVRSGRQSRAR